MKVIQHWEVPHNKIPVFYQPDQTSHVVSNFVRVGSMSDPPRILQGRAHIMEHVAANRTRNLQSAELQAVLRTYSAHYWRESGIWTSFMNTSFGCGLLRRDDYIRDLFPIFAQMVTSPVINEEILNTERAAILNEWALHGEDDIDDRINRKLLALIYSTNPVLMRMDCDPAQMMASGTLGRLRKFWEEQYVASNIAVIILGPDRARTKRMALKAFGDLPPTEAPAIPYDTSDIQPVLTEVKREEFEYGDEEHRAFHLIMGFPTAPWGSEHDESLDVAAEFLEFHIEDQVRDQNTDPRLGTYHPSVWTERTKFHGMFYVRMPAVSLDGARRAEEIVKQEIQKIRAGHLLDSMLDQAQTETPKTKEKTAALRILKRILGRGVTSMKRPIVDSFLDAFVVQPQILAELITDYYCNGGMAGVEKLNNFKRTFKKVTKDGVVRAANEFLHPDRYACVLAKPRVPLNFNSLIQRA